METVVVLENTGCPQVCKIGGVTRVQLTNSRYISGGTTGPLFTVEAERSGIARGGGSAESPARKTAALQIHACTAGMSVRQTMVSLHSFRVRRRFA